jgi:hypothetical protein
MNALGVVVADTTPLNLIDLADEQGLLDGIAALNDLRKTTFRADPALLGRFEARMKARQG